MFQKSDYTIFNSLLILSLFIILSIAFFCKNWDYFFYTIIIKFNKNINIYIIYKFFLKKSFNK